MDDMVNVPGIEPEGNPVQSVDVEVTSQKSKKLPVIIGTAVGAVAVIVLAIVLICSLFCNSYKTPIKTAEKILNTKKNFDVEDMAMDLLNGYAKKDVKNILKILKKSDVYTDAIDEIEEKLDDVVEMAEDKFGKNYKISLKITDKHKLDEDDWEEFEEWVNKIGKELKNEIKKMDSDDIEEMADELDISKSDAKKLNKSVKNVASSLSKAKVTKGYELEIAIKITGKELDDPMEHEIEIEVYKVDGKWILNPLYPLKVFTDYQNKEEYEDIRNSMGSLPRPSQTIPETIPDMYD